MRFKFPCKVLLIALTALATISCNDLLDPIGFTIQPGKDRLSIGTDTLELQARTVQIDSIFSKTQYPVLGEYTDPIFGNIKSEYIGEFYFPEDTRFHDGASIDSVRVQLAYTTMMGDSLSPMELSVYEVNKSLKGISSYSHVDPTEYADMSAPLGTQVFTGRNSTFRIENPGTANAIRVYEINVMLPKALGQKFLDEFNKEGHGHLVNVDEFRKFFPGLYFTTTFGKSTIINVELTSLLVHYNYLDRNGSHDGKRDTVRTSTLPLYITPEVTQINHIQNKNEQLLEDNPDYTYIKSPAGVMTEIVFPLSEMEEKLQSQALNLANFSVYAIPESQENSMVKLNPPNYLLLVNKDSLSGFFEKKRLEDRVTSFVSARFNPSTYSYQFGNISTMINYYKERQGDKPGDSDLVYYLVPVDATYTTQQSGYYGGTTQVLTALHHRMWPAGAMLDKRKGNLKLDMIFSNF